MTKYKSRDFAHAQKEDVRGRTDDREPLTIDTSLMHAFLASGSDPTARKWQSDLCTNKHYSLLCNDYVIIAHA